MSAWEKQVRDGKEDPSREGATGSAAADVCAAAPSPGRAETPDENAPRRTRRRVRRHRGAGTFVALHLACVLLPLGVVVAWAFTSSWPWPDLLPQSFSERGLAEIFAPTQKLAHVLAQSVGIALAVAALSTLVASLAARALTHHRFFGREAFRFATVLPFLIPSPRCSPWACRWRSSVRGWRARVAGVVLAHTIVALPYAMTIMTDVTEAAGTRLEEQARVLGAGPFSTLVHVQLPLLLPGVLSASAMSYILSFSQYFLTLLIGGGAVKTPALDHVPPRIRPAATAPSQAPTAWCSWWPRWRCSSSSRFCWKRHASARDGLLRWDKRIRETGVLARGNVGARAYQDAGHGLYAREDPHGRVRAGVEGYGPGRHGRKAAGRLTGEGKDRRSAYGTDG